MSQCKVLSIQEAVMSKGIQIKAHDTTLIENRLRSASVGEIVAYEALSRIIGRDVRQFCTGNMKTARDTLEKDEKIVFDTIANVGFKRMSEPEKSTSIDRMKKSIQRKAKRGLVRASVVDFDSLEQAQKQKHLASITQLGVISEFTSAKGTKKIEEKVRQTSAAVSIGDAVKLFGG